MTQPIPDAISALIAHLKADANVAARVGVKVYGNELPRSENVNMPQSCIVLRYAGARQQTGRLPIGDYRIDIRSYGATPFESARVYRAVHTAMKQSLLRKAYGTQLLHSASQESGPLSLREPDVEWPFLFSAWIVKAAEIPKT